MTCRWCGEQLDAADRFCEACGTAVDRVDGASDRREEDLGAVAAVSDRGPVRARNEDAFSIYAEGDYQAAVVCDGVASTDQSAAAASGAADAAIEELRKGIADTGGWVELIGRAVAAAQTTLSEAAPDGSPVYEGSTTIVAALAGPGRVVVANVGDSRAYWVGRGGEAELLTIDDTWVREALDAGMPEEMALASGRAHEITAWLGADAWAVEPHVTELTPTGDGWAVICSDGLWNYAEPAGELAAQISGAARPAAIAWRLAEFALRSGGADNVTVVVATVPVTGEKGAHELRR